MFESLLASGSLVYLAAAIQTVGFLIRDQLALRALILLGTVIYIAYYYIAPTVPLWDAIACSVLMGLANAYTMVRIVADRRPARFSEEDLIVYQALPQIAPSDFRRIMAVAEKVTVTGDTVLTEQDTVPGHLYFLVDGEILLEKNGTARSLDQPMFIGEIAYLLGRPASATVTLRAGGRYARWKASEIRALTAKHDSVRGALEIAFNRDLATKVAAS